MQRSLCEPSPSPESTSGPSAAAGSSSGGSRAQRHVRFDQLPPSVSLLQAQFRQRAAKYEKLQRERSPEPRASLDSDQDEDEECEAEEECEQQLQQQGASLTPQQLQQLRERREQQQAQARRQMKRSRDESVGLAAGSDEEDSAMSKPGQQLEGLEQELDCAGSKRIKASEVC